MLGRLYQLRALKRKILYKPVPGKREWDKTGTISRSEKIDGKQLHLKWKWVE